MKYTLKDKYSKMLEIYPDFNAILNRKIKNLGKENVFGQYIRINNVLTGCYDNLYISEVFLNKENDEYLISPKTPLSFILNKDVLEDSEYNKLQQCIQNQLEDGTNIVSCRVNIEGHAQHFNIPKKHIIKIS